VGLSALEPPVALAALSTSTSEPTPAPVAPGVEPDLVTPGVIGFAFTAVFIVIVILLVIDMTKRMRRVRYRSEARERIAAELDAQVAGEEKPAGPQPD